MSNVPTEPHMFVLYVGGLIVLVIELYKFIRFIAKR